MPYCYTPSVLSKVMCSTVVQSVVQIQMPIAHSVRVTAVQLSIVQQDKPSQKKSVSDMNWMVSFVLNDYGRVAASFVARTKVILCSPRLVLGW